MFLQFCLEQVPIHLHIATRIFIFDGLLIHSDHLFGLNHHIKRLRFFDRTRFQPRQQDFVVKHLFDGLAQGRMIISKI